MKWKFESAKLRFVINDVWIGVYWQRNRLNNVWYRGTVFHRIDELDIWICLVPCVPIHITYFGFEPKRV